LQVSNYKKTVQGGPEFESVDDISNINYCDDSIQLTIEQHFLVVLFIVLYKGKMFEYVD